MAAYSSKADVRDELLKPVSTEAEHDEAEREINRQLKRRNIDPAVVDEEALKELSINYACWRRALYSKKASKDGYASKEDSYKLAYEEALEDIDLEYAKGIVDTGGVTTVGDTQMRRG